MMTEQEIRALTCSIQEAYREMTGITAPPTIAEFLSMRSAAMEELKQGVHMTASPAAITYTQAVTTPMTSVEPVHHAAAVAKPSLPPKSGNEPLNGPATTNVKTADKLEAASRSADKTEETKAEQKKRGPGSKVIELTRAKQQPVPENDNDTEENLSDFEILKRAGNPWN